MWPHGERTKEDSFKIRNTNSSEDRNHYVRIRTRALFMICHASKYATDWERTFSTIINRNKMIATSRPTTAIHRHINWSWCSVADIRASRFMSMLVLAVAMPLFNSHTHTHTSIWTLCFVACRLNGWPHALLHCIGLIDKNNNCALVCIVRAMAAHDMQIIRQQQSSCAENVCSFHSQSKHKL